MTSDNFSFQLSSPFTLIYRFFPSPLQGSFLFLLLIPYFSFVPFFLFFPPCLTSSQYQVLEFALQQHERFRCVPRLSGLLVIGTSSSEQLGAFRVPDHPAPRSLYNYLGRNGGRGAGLATTTRALHLPACNTVSPNTCWPFGI